MFMSIFKKFLHFGLITYLAAMFGSLLFAVAKIDFTGNEVGRLGLIIVMVTTGIVAYRWGFGMLRQMNLINRIA